MVALRRCFQEKQTTLAQYVERMKEKQDAIFYMAGTSLKEVALSQPSPIFYTLFLLYCLFSVIPLRCAVRYELCGADFRLIC